MKRGKTTSILFHILVWVVLILLPVYSARRFQMGSNFLLSYYTFMIISAVIFYVNYLFLVPRLFFQKKRSRYFIAALVLLVCCYFIFDFANDKVLSYIRTTSQEQLNLAPGEQRRPPRPPRSGIIRIFIPHAQLIAYSASSAILVFLSLGLKVLERQTRMEKIHEEMEKAKLSTELAFLKNQVSPHFFFNTLNNIYSLIGRNNEESKDAIIKLSKLMRYVLNESGQENRPLSGEIEFMNNYIDLMRLRIGSKTRLSVNFPSVYRDLMIPHLLFISLIENAFKYGISVQEDSYLNISLECKENNLQFICENGIPENGFEPVFSSPGIGLENLRKRLALIYPDRHELVINRTKEKFEVRLNIQL